jgi:hypothetical protein
MIYIDGMGSQGTREGDDIPVKFARGRDIDTGNSILWWQSETSHEGLDLLGTAIVYE